MLNRILPTRFAVATALVLGLGISGAAKAASTASSTAPSPSRFASRASHLLAQVQRDAWAVQNNADHLQMHSEGVPFLSEEVGYTPEANDLARIKNRVNAMDKDMRQLRLHADQLQPWQRQAVEQMAPDMADLTVTTQAAIHSLNKNRGHLFTAPLETYSTDIYNLAEHIGQSAQEHGQSANAHPELQRLRHDLHLPL